MPFGAWEEPYFSLTKVERAARDYSAGGAWPRLRVHEAWGEIHSSGYCVFPVAFTLLSGNV